MTELKIKLTNNLYEVLVRTVHSDGSETFQIEYSLNFQGQFVHICTEPDAGEQREVVLEKICAKIPSLTPEELSVIWETRQINI